MYRLFFITIVFFTFFSNSARANIGSNYKECMQLVGDKDYCRSLFPTTSPPSKDQLACVNQVIKDFYGVGMFAYPLDGCAVRIVEFYTAILNECGVTAEQVWIYSGNNGMSPCPGVLWGQHTAVLIRDENGDVLIGDPGLCSTLVPWRDWTNACVAHSGGISRCKSGPLINPFLIDPNYATAASWRYRCFGDLANNYKLCGDDEFCKDAALDACYECDAQCPSGTPPQLTCDSVPRDGWGLR